MLSFVEKYFIIIGIKNILILVKCVCNLKKTYKGIFMEKILITTEETANLSEELLNKYNIKKCDVHYYVNGVEYYSKDNNLSPEQFYTSLKNGSDVKTSQINMQEAIDFLEPYYKEGYRILHISFSSKLSGICNNFKLAMEELNEKYNIECKVVDSLIGAMGQGIVAIETAKQLQNGLSYDELYDFANNLKDKVNGIYTFEDLRYALNGGRIAKLKALIANVLNIKAILCSDKNGEFASIGKAFGRQLAVKQLAEKIVKNYDPKYKEIYICEGDSIEDANKLSNMIETKLGVKPTILPLTFFIGCHGGPGTLALFYVGNERY